MHPLLPFLFLTQCLLASMSPTLDTQPRFGIFFSPTTITASRFNSSGLLELTKFRASPKYQTYYHNAVDGSHPADGDFNEAKSMFEHAIGPLTSILNKQLGEPPEYASLFLPSIFDEQTRGAAFEAIIGDPEYATKAALVQNAACWPYGFLEGKNLGRPPHECVADGPESSVLVLEDEEAYVHAWIVEVAFELGTYFVNQDKICKNCGEVLREVSTYATIPATL